MESLLDTIYAGIPWPIVCFALLLTWTDLVVMLGIAWHQRTLSSAKWKKGIKDKCLMSGLIAYSILLKAFFVVVEIPADTMALAGMADVSDIPICAIICGLICLMEIYSTLENFAQVNPIAKRILSVFRVPEKGETQ